MDESNPSVQVARSDGVARVTLNRPERYNAMTVPMMRRLAAAIEESAAVEDVRCIILASTGRGFCTGQDLNVLSKQHEHGDPAAIGDVLRNDYNPVPACLRAIDKPVIAAVQGVAAGAGWSLVLACDLRIATRSARFVPAFRDLGLVPDLGGTASLVEAIGYARAMEFALLTQELSAEQAQALGMINAVVDVGELDATVQAWAERIAALPPRGVAQTKRMMRAALGIAWAQRLRAEAWAQTICADEPEHRERVAAWRRGR